MAREKKKPSGGRVSDERGTGDEALGAGEPVAPRTTMAKYGGAIIPVVVFGLIALAVIADMLLR